MSVALLIITDGRDDYLSQCVNSLHHLHGPIAERWMYDDTGDEAYRATLRQRYPEWAVFDAGPRQGCAGAFRAAWSHLRNNCTADHVFLIEQDFEFIRPVDLDGMSGLLAEHPHLAEVALLRQAWNTQEIAAGGVIQQHPEWYADRSDDQGREWLEQGAFFTTNPCLFRRSLLDVEWPAHRPGSYSEGTFHQTLMRDGTPEVPGAQVRYAYWGSRGSGIWVRHIGEIRHGHGMGY